MRAHTITTKASTIVSGGILALGLAVVLLAATASTASADRGLTERSSGVPYSSPTLSPWYCPPPATQSTTLEQVRGCLDFTPEPSFGFGDRQVGTASPAQPFGLGVWDNDSFNPTISVSGDYAQTNNCPPTLSAGAFPQIQGCLINVTFAPTGTGPRHGTLSTGPGGPTVALTGKGVTTPTPWDWPVELSVADKTQNPTIHPGSCDGPTPALTCGANCERYSCSVIVRASCGGAACTARAEGRLTEVENDKLRPSRIDLDPGETKALELKVPLKTRLQAGKALAEGKKVEARVTVRATDAAGKVTTAKRTIRLGAGRPVK
jgi:hypothetical protein